MNPLKAAEKLCYAVFGQSRNRDLIILPPLERALYRPDWTKSLFKTVFAVYMLVTVVVLVKLLIATMSDTYQQIQAQSDIQWKYGLSRLIRNIDRTTTAPSPLNLITTWFLLLYGFCKAKVNKMKYDRMSPRTRAGEKWISKIKDKKEGTESHRASLAVSSFMQFTNSIDQSKSIASKIVTIEEATDWRAISNKYRAVMQLSNIEGEGGNYENDSVRDEDEKQNS